MATRIGIMSDTHGYWDDRYLKYFEDCDEIWHAGDIGNGILERLKEKKMVRAVRGNADGGDVRLNCRDILRFTVEEVDVLLTHIGGYPGRYNPNVRQEFLKSTPRLFVCGHSHILKVMADKKFGMLCVNPGAAGRYGQQTVRTLVRLVIDGDTMRDLEVIELTW